MTETLASRILHMKASNSHVQEMIKKIGDKIMKQDKRLIS